MQVAAGEVEPLDLLERGAARILRRRVRHELEHVRDQGAVPRLFSPMDLDDVPGLHADVPACGMVREFTHSIVIADPDSKYRL